MSRIRGNRENCITGSVRDGERFIGCRGFVGAENRHHRSLTTCKLESKGTGIGRRSHRRLNRITDGRHLIGGTAQRTGRRVKGQSRRWCWGNGTSCPLRRNGTNQYGLVGGICRVARLWILNVCGHLDVADKRLQLVRVNGGRGGSRDGCAIVGE